MICAIGGFLGEAQDWDLFKELFLSVDKELYIPSFYSNKAGSESGLCALTIDQAAHQLASRLAPQSTLIAYSQGARLALHMALFESNFFSKVILVSSGLGLKNPSECEQRLKHDQVWASRFLSESWPTLLSDWNAQPVFQNSKPLPRSEHSFSRQALASSLVNWSQGTHEYLLPHLHKIKAKLHWIAGEYDKKYLHLAQDAAGQSGKLHIVPHAGHRALWDQPQTALSIIQSILFSSTYKNQ